MTMKSSQPIKLFYCYAREDQASRDDLDRRFEVLRRLGLITDWYDGKVVPGTPWEEEIKAHLDDADIILLLVSVDFLSSEYCYSKEMLRAIERHQRGEAVVIPIILRDTPFWEETPFGEIQALPTDAVPVDNKKWHSPDEAFKDVASGIRRVIDEIRSRRSSALNLSTTVPSIEGASSSSFLDQQEKEEPQSAKKQVQTSTLQPSLPTMPVSLVTQANDNLNDKTRFSASSATLERNFSFSKKHSLKELYIPLIVGVLLLIEVFSLQYLLNMHNIFIQIVTFSFITIFFVIAVLFRVMSFGSERRIATSNVALSVALFCSICISFLSFILQILFSNNQLMFAFILFTVIAIGISYLARR